MVAIVFPERETIVNSESTFSGCPARFDQKNALKRRAIFADHSDTIFHKQGFRLGVPRYETCSAPEPTPTPERTSITLPERGPEITETR